MTTQEQIGHTELPWDNGGHGLTGPTTPSVSGVTVAEYLDRVRSQRTGEEVPNLHRAISVGSRTIALVVWEPGCEAEGVANAEFILRAVNSHYQLVAACEAALKAEWMVTHDWGGDREAVLNLLRAALEAAKP